MCGRMVRHTNSFPRPSNMAFRSELYSTIQIVPRPKHIPSSLRKPVSQAVKIVAVCSANHTKHLNALYVHNAEFLNVKPLTQRLGAFT